MKTKTPEQIAADAVREYGFSDYPRTHCIESGTAYAVALFAIRADRAQLSAALPKVDDLNEAIAQADESRESSELEDVFDARDALDDLACRVLDVAKEMQP